MQCICFICRNLTSKLDSGPLNNYKIKYELPLYMGPLTTVLSSDAEELITQWVGLQAPERQNVVNEPIYDDISYFVLLLT